VVPVYNDQEVLQELYRRLNPVVESLATHYEIVLVDDGSKDHSWDEIMKLREADDHIVAVKLARNFGQQNSIAAGLNVVKGEIIVLMDSDLQDRPEDIPVLIDTLLKSGTQMAIAQWQTRQDTWAKRTVSNIFNRVSNTITAIHIEPHLGVFRAIRRSVVDELKKFPEKTSTTLSLLYYIGANYAIVPLKRDARFAGKSGYNVRKMFGLTFARIFSFSMFPIRIVTYLGMFMSIISFLVGIALIFYKLFGNVVTGWTSTIVLILFLFGLNFAFLGVLGEYIGKVFLETKQRPNYIIEKIC
ncbi:MAG: glycosyltransferase family 2 protein, partial [Paludibacteraceae bacterium]|nr:glycosyltransferase family 2 protein [Paludibacteraceae bacterium]